MKTIYVLILVFVCSVSFADNYVVLEGNKVRGTARVKDNHLPTWEKDFTMIKTDKFVGKHSWEIKYENGKLRPATQQEIDDYFALKEAEKQNKKKQAALDALGLTEIDLDRIKGL